MIEMVIKCIRCEGSMEDGYVLDRGHYNARMVNTWVEGEPVKSFWSGLNVDDRQQYEVRTFRCTECGYLESYANEELS
jgi:DNA-directed RNA polymerase subunit RPC12/RpoP